MRDRLDAAIAALETPCLRLAAALAPLRSVVSVLVTGAHPDDEMSAMLAALVRRDGVRVTYACATRGEGGQNAIGRESGATLGALRTREMEEAARRLGIGLRWLGESGTDPITDFGFAKTAESTFAHWGFERVVARLVAIIRAEKPDIVWPTFLDVPGQHGHHRAVTRATIEAVRRAADPTAAHPEFDGRPWRIAKLYLPAWSGGGDTYDDAAAPPNASVLYDATGIDSASGLTYAQLGECARAAHASQGMGRWPESGPVVYPLHRLDRGISEASIFDGLPRRLEDPAAQAAIDRVLAAWPDPRRIEAAAELADEQLAQALVALDPAQSAVSGHRLERKRQDIARVLAVLRGETPNKISAPDPTISIRIEPDAVIVNRLAGAKSTGIEIMVEVEAGARIAVTMDTPSGWSAIGMPKPFDLAPHAAHRAVFDLEIPEGAEPALHELALRIDDAVATQIHRATYPHVGTIVATSPTILRVRMLDVALPASARIAYVGGGGDRVDVWLTRLGLDVTVLDAPALASADLARFTTVLVGISALRTRIDLAAALPRLHAWVRKGGHLVTLYHRPSDNWDERNTALAPLAIGTPSLRWRVCDPAAPVTPLAPTHPLLATPNRIGPKDWEGWCRERGLYFAARWDDAYRPLLAMNDPAETPLTGALLSGRFGRGQHTHTGLALHHQIEHLVPGALRLIANLVQPATPPHPDEATL